MNTPAIVANNKDYLVVNKPPFMAVEPPSHNDTLLEWLISGGYVQPEAWPAQTRYGIVHRLDSNTSGLIIWAKNPSSQEKLRLMWQGRKVKKSYLALVLGQTAPEGEIDLSVSRDNKHDKQQVDLIPTTRSRSTITTYKTLKVGEWEQEKMSLLEVHPITGRTHQIRVHMEAIGHPIIGDEIYSTKASRLISKKLGINRQFLHASEILLPSSKQFVAELPDDLQSILDEVFVSRVN